MADGSVLLELVRIQQWFGGVRALEDVSCKVFEDQTVALIGPNGAGKTTLLNVITGTVRSTGGEVVLRGRPIGHLAAPERVRLGLVRTFQQALLFDGMTALENVMVGAHLRGRSGLASAALRLPSACREEEDLYLEGMRFLNLVGLGSKAQDGAGSLPFGQQRLLAIARALAAEPSLLLLDEPAAGLNRLEKDSLADLIRRIRESGVTVLLVEHDMELVMRLADWVVVLDRGRRLAQGTPVDVRRNPAVIEAYLGRKDGGRA